MTKLAAATIGSTARWRREACRWLPQRSRIQQDHTRRFARMVVKSEDGVARKALEEAVGDHPLGATVLARFLGGLEDQLDGAGEMTRSRQIFGGA